ncbi:MAG: TrkH family potassium uptake protein [Inquilinaceae bacterium]
MVSHQGFASPTKPSGGGSSLDPRPILFVIGLLLVILGAAMAVPMVVDLAADSVDWRAFALSGTITLFVGVSLVASCRQDSLSLGLRQTFLLTTASWLTVALFSALPIYFSVAGLDLADAVFEAMSGLTTTGSTVLSGLDIAPAGLLLWRSLLQWLGGIGIVGMGIAILPFLRVGGMQLFRTESSDRSDKVVPRVADLMRDVGILYAGLTLACAVALRVSGMSTFDAVNHAMTAVSTGGFSTKDSSIGYFGQPAIHWVLVVFMTAGALPFVRYISLVKGDAGAFWRDRQVRVFLVLLVAVSVGTGVWLSAATGRPLSDAMRLAFLNVTSVMTTTGYASDDYTLWGPFAVALFFLLTMIGGCTGSTSGAIKIFRFQILWMALKSQLVRLYSPHSVRPLVYDGKPVTPDVLMSVMGFIFVFAFLLLVVACALSAFGLDFTTALSGAATALTNVGPGLGPIIGPAGNFSTLPDGAKWILTGTMLLGRLEYFTVLVLFSRQFWRV